MTRRWPLILLALPAGVATWSGWVGLSELTGFGPVKPLPGISDFTINTAVTLPIGVEAYAGYALHAWLAAGEVSARTRRFAAWSALGSLVLGMLGQIAYHLLAVSGVKAAPWWVVTAVSCMPVLVLGMGAALGHMLHRDARAVPQESPEPVETVEAVEVAEPDTTPAPEAVEEQADAPAELEPAPAETPVLAPVPDELCPVAAERYAGELAEGKVPALSRLKQDLRIGQKRAQTISAYLGLLTRTT